MIYCLGHNIISPLGEGSEQNYQAVATSRSGLKLYTDRFADVEPFCASIFAEPQGFVDLCVRTAQTAIAEAGIDATAKDVIFVLSTTKGDNLDLITPAKAIAKHFGNVNSPIVVSNACTSGVCAQITAKRLIESGLYRHAVVIGCDIQTRFIVSGFQSFKALSDEPCKPFSEDRRGLNLGEAAASIVWSAEPHDGWVLEAGSIHNDANHISGPSRIGEGLYRCLRDVLQGVEVEEVKLLGVHGTATPYNDAMEKIAIERAGLQDVPISALKPYFGHTMGAAGVLETIMCMQLLQHGTFIKMLSGFGGVNAAIRLRCE